MQALTSLLNGPEAAMLAVLPIGIILLVVALFAGSGARRQIARRIERVHRNHKKKESTPEQMLSARRDSGDQSSIESILKRLVPNQEVLRMRLARAGWEINLGSYVLICLVVAALAFVVARMSGFVPGAAAILFGIMAGIGLPHYVVGTMFKRRQMKFIQYFPEAIDLMVRGVRAGLPITEAIKAAGDETPDPVGIELRRVTDGVRLGRKMDEVLWESSRRLDLQEFKFFTIALSIQAETGGNLAETLNNLAEVLRGRRQIKRKIKALSSEAKASAYIIGSLPFIMTGLIYLVNSHYIVGLFTDVRGQIMIGFGLLMIFSGAMVMRKMVKFEI